MVQSRRRSVSSRRLNQQKELCVDRVKDHGYVLELIFII